MIKRLYPVKCDQFGIRFVPRGPKDNHVCLQILSEDDGHWHQSMGQSFSSFWLDDLIRALQEAKLKLDTKAVFQSDGFGWKFRQDKEPK